MNYEFWMMNRNRAKASLSPIDSEKPRTCEIGPRYPRYPLRLNHAPGKMGHPDDASEELYVLGLNSPMEDCTPQVAVMY